MTPLLFAFAKKLERDMAARRGGRAPTLLLLGDPAQEVFAYNEGARRQGSWPTALALLTGEGKHACPPNRGGEAHLASSQGRGCTLALTPLLRRS